MNKYIEKLRDEFPKNVTDFKSVFSMRTTEQFITECLEEQRKEVGEKLKSNKVDLELANGSRAISIVPLGIALNILQQLEKGKNDS